MSSVKLLKIFLVAAVIAGSARLADAGWKATQNVYADPSSGWAYGSMGSARNSASSIEMLDCEVTVFSPTSAPFVTCWARSAAGQTVYCYSDSPNLLQVAGHIGDSSFVGFRADASGTCTYLDVVNASFVEPKLP